MQQPAYYDARTRDWNSEKDHPNALPNAQQHESTTTPSDQNHYDAVDGKNLDRTLTADSHVHHKMNGKLFMALTAMSFLWVGSQIPLYLYGSVLPLIYQDIGGVDRWPWFVIGYLIPNAALCPFVGALSDLFGRRIVAIVGQVLLIVGPIVTATANTMNVAIAGQVLSGLGAGLNELIALAGTAELVPVSKRGFYVGGVVVTILPFCPSVVYAQLIARASNWRYVGIPVGVWNFLGLILCTFFYKDPPRIREYSKKDVLRQVDFIGGFLSITGILCFMMGLQWGARQYTWSSTHVLAPFILGLVLIIAFFIWELYIAKYPMCPRRLFSKSKGNMVKLLLITFFSGGNFFVLLLFWPTQIYNVYGPDPVGIGIRSLPIGFGIILGAVLALALIPLTKGRAMHILYFFCIIMTAFTGAISCSTPGNLPLMYFLVTFASIGVGGVIIPASIIAQICCPHELIATITAITLSVRYIGGAIAYCAYYNIFYHNFTKYATNIIARDTLIYKGVVPYPIFDTHLTPQQRTAYETTLLNITTLVGNAQFDALREQIATNPLVEKKDQAFGIILAGAQQAFALAYRYPYWMSIAFGGLCILLAREITDIRKLMGLDTVAATNSAVPPAAEEAKKHHDEEERYGHEDGVVHTASQIDYAHPQENYSTPNGGYNPHQINHTTPPASHEAPRL